MVAAPLGLLLNIVGLLVDRSKRHALMGLGLTLLTALSLFFAVLC